MNIPEEGETCQWEREREADRENRRRSQRRMSTKDRKNVSDAIVMYRAGAKFRENEDLSLARAHSFRGEDLRASHPHSRKPKLCQIY